VKNSKRSVTILTKIKPLVKLVSFHDDFIPQLITEIVLKICWIWRSYQPECISSSAF